MLPCAYMAARIVSCLSSTTWIWDTEAFLLIWLLIQVEVVDTSCSFRRTCTTRKGVTTAVQPVHLGMHAHAYTQTIPVVPDKHALRGPAAPEGRPASRRLSRNGGTFPQAVPPARLCH